MNNQTRWMACKVDDKRVFMEWKRTLSSKTFLCRRKFYTFA